MQLMNLKRVGNALFITEEECNRLVKLLKDNRNLYYEEPFVKIAIDGHTKSLQFYGLKVIPVLFAQSDNMGGIKHCDTFTQGLKSMIKSIEIGEGAKEISYYAFNEFTGVEQVVLPTTLEVIDNGFVNCTSLKSIKLPDGLKEIRGETFINVPLKEIEIPSSIVKLNTAFKATALKRVVIPKNVRILQGTFTMCRKLEEVVFEDGLIELQYDAFYGCDKLRKISLPDSLHKIGDYAFAGCKNLTDIKIPNDCIVAKNAFYGCPYNEIYKRDKLNVNPILFDGEIDEDLFKSISKVLKGKKYSEQLEYFVLIECDESESYSYGKSTGGNYYQCSKPVYDSDSIDNVIVYDDIVVGVVINNKTLIIDKPVCTYYACEDDGAGSRSVEVYTTLKFKC